MGWITGVPIFIWKLFVLFVIFPITVVVEVLRFIAQLIAWSPGLFFLLALWLIGSAASAYGSTAVVYTEYVFRCVINPAVTNFVGPLLNLLRTIYNPTICVWDALNWFTFGYFNYVIVPDAVACGASAVLVNIGCVATQLFDSLVVFLATGEFLTGFYDMSLLSASLVQLVESWIVMLCCLCQDLCCLVKIVPFLLPLPPPLMILIPAMSTQYLFWQSIESLINLWAAILQILWPLIIDLLNFTSPMNRPNYLVAASFGCQFFERFNPALENTIQGLWDTYIPWRFNFTGTLAWNTAISCIVVDSVQVVLTVATNVDIVVFNMFTPWPNTYIGPPYTMPIDLWHGQIEQSIKQILNTWAPTTNPEFYFDVHSIGRQTVIEGACTVITRVICDWNNTDVPCFNDDPNFANETMNNGFLAGFNWCCFTNTAVTAVNDFNVIVYSFWLHTTSAADWFGWLATVGPQLLIVANDLVAVADCVFSLVDAVPVVGYCLKQVMVQLFRFVILVATFGLQVLIALITLVWDAINGTLSSNFLLDGPGAIDEWDGIMQILLGNTSSSLTNCISYILNYGIQIPPITLNANGQVITCGPPQCQPVDFIPPPPVIGRDGTGRAGFPASGHLIDLHAGYSRGSKLRQRVTPLLVYETYNNSHTKGPARRGGLWERFKLVFHQPRSLPGLPNGEELVESRRQRFYDRYHQIHECHTNDVYKRELRRDNPWRWKVMKANNKLPDTSHCLEIGAYDNIYPGKDRRDQRRIFMSSVDSFGIASTWAPPTWWPDRLAIPNETEYALHGTRLSLQLPMHQDHEDDQSVSEEATTASKKSKKLIPPPPPLTQRPTQAPISGCPPPGDPPNPCFNLACFPVAFLHLVGQIGLTLGNLLDGLIRGNFPSAGEVQWGYFTGGNCPRCLEQDIVTLVNYALDPLICTCRLLELILPSSPQFPQPDFCCALTSLADFIANSIQVIINSIQSLALDSPVFTYFNDGYFVRDIDVLFAELLEIVFCLCQFVRYVFPITQLTGGTIYGGGAFDICCIPMVLVDTGIELAQLIILSIINLATIEGQGIAFWQFSTEQPDLDKIGFLIQVDVVLETFFGSPGGVCAAQGRPQGIGGITSCICQIVALLFPIRQNPNAPISPTNCPTVDLCCPIREGGYLAKDLLAFIITAIAGLWQSWDPAVNGHCNPGWLQPGQSCASLPQEPYAFLDFVFCNELTPWELAHLPLTPVQQQQQAKCGKFLPIIAEFVEIISTCPCEFLSLADAWLALYFQGFDCFCGPVDGVFTNLGDLTAAVTTSVVTLIRRINDPTYWQPFGQPSPNGGPNQFNEMNTWTWEFFGPIIDSACLTITSLTCFLDILLPFCQQLRARIVESIVRWGFEIIVKVGAFIEGVVGIFTTGSQCSDPGQSCAGGSPQYGVSVSQLADIFTSLVSFPIDAAIGDSTVVCSVLNPPQCPPSNLCCCYNPAGSQPGVLFTHVTTGPVFSNPNYQCAQCLDATCSTYEDSYAYRTCAQEGSPQVPCFNDTINGGSGLVSCSTQNPALLKLDGIIMAFLRYFQCILTQLVPGFGPVLQGLVVLVSVVWQLANSFLRLLASVIMFVFALPLAASGALGPFGIIGLVGQFFDIFTALASAFSETPVIPQTPSFRETRGEFRARLGHVANQPLNATTATDIIRQMLGVVWDFTTEDCWHNFTACACRNWGFDEGDPGLELCNSVFDQHRRGLRVPSHPVLHAVGKTMRGSTFCDQHLNAFVNGTTWETMAHTDKVVYVECMEKIIQGGRLNDAAPMFPADYFYRHDGLLQLWDNAKQAALQAVDNNHRDILRERHQRRVLPDNVYELRWRHRNEKIERYTSQHPRWRKSMITSALIAIDQYEYKLRSGFYMPLFKQALRNIQREELPRISIRERLGIMGRQLQSIGGNIMALQIKQGARDLYEAIVALPDVFEQLSTRSWWSIYWDAVQRGNAHPRRAKERAAGEERRELVRAAMRKSPLYKWWYNVTEPGEATVSTTERPHVNPIARLVDHLSYVFKWQRAHWRDSPATFANMDLHMRANFGEWFQRRTRIEWTPQIVANWASFGRIWYRIKEGVWPGSVSRDTQERFSVGPFCNVSWTSKRDDPRTSNFSHGIGPNCTEGDQMMREIQESRALVVAADEERKRAERGFIIGGNCLLADGFINELVFLTIYCTKDYTPQLPPFQRSSLEGSKGGWGVLMALANQPQHAFHSKKEVWPKHSPHETPEEWRGWGTWLKHRSLDWIRPKLPWPSGPRASDWRRSISHQQWLRSMAATSFDFFQWILGVLDNWFGLNLAYTLANWIDDVEAWFLNTNEDYCLGVESGIGVGFDYWVKFPLRCIFQPMPGTLPCNAALNLNCKVGIGLEKAIGWVTFYMAVIYAGISLLMPPLLAFASFIGLVLLWLILVPAVAWHYSPRCWLMSPAAIVPGEGAVGITIPYWPFPIAFPALPFCAMDDITALVIKYTSMCWCEIWWGTPLQFICPPYAVLGNPCPPCPDMIGIANCRNIGMAGGIDNIIWLGMHWFPNFGTWVSAFAQIVFLSGHFGSTLASIGDYLLAAVARFSNVTPPEEELFWWCFGLTSPSIAGPVLFFVLTWLILGLAWLLFTLAISAIWGVVVASPILWLFPGLAQGSAYESLGGTTDDDGGGGGGPDQQPYVAVTSEIQLDNRGIARRVYVPVQRRPMQQSLLFDSLDKLYASIWTRLRREWHG